MITTYKKQSSIILVSTVLAIVMFAGQIIISSDNSAYAFVRFHGGFHGGFHGHGFHGGFHGHGFHGGFHGHGFHGGFHDGFHGGFHDGFHGGFGGPNCGPNCGPNDGFGFDQPSFFSDDGEHSSVHQSISQSCIQPQSSSVLSSGGFSPVVSSGNNIASCANVNLGGNAAAVNQ